MKRCALSSIFARKRCPLGRSASALLALFPLLASQAVRAQEPPPAPGAPNANQDANQVAGPSANQTTGEATAVGTYHQVIRDALSEYDAGNYAEARALFEQAHGLRPSARTLRGLGMASFELRNYVRAERELKGALEETRQPLTIAQRAEVTALLQRVDRYVGKLILRVQPDTATILLDGASIPPAVELDLGPHELSVQAPGHRPLNRIITIEGGKEQTLDLVMIPLEIKAPEAARTVAPPPEAAEPAPVVAPLQTDYSMEDDGEVSSNVLEKWWFWTAIGVVVAGGVVTGIALSSKTETEPLIAGDNGKVVRALTIAH